MVSLNFLKVNLSHSKVTRKLIFLTPNLTTLLFDKLQASPKEKKGNNNVHPLWPIYIRWEEDNICQSIRDKKASAIGNVLRNIAKTWAKNWECDGNPFGTWWEHIGNLRKWKKKSFSPVSHPTPTQKGQKIWGILRCYWEHIREHIENLMGTHWEQKKNL
jgi:hypothetical protein